MRARRLTREDGCLGHAPGCPLCGKLLDDSLRQVLAAGRHADKLKHDLAGPTSGLRQLDVSNDGGLALLPLLSIASN